MHSRLVQDVLAVVPVDLVELTGLSNTDIQAVVSRAAEAVAPAAITVRSLGSMPQAVSVSEIAS